MKTWILNYYEFTVYFNDGSYYRTIATSKAEAIGRLEKKLGHEIFPEEIQNVTKSPIKY